MHLWCIYMPLVTVTRIEGMEYFWDTINCDRLYHLKYKKAYLLLSFSSLRPYTHALQWCHNERDGVSNHQPHDCLLKRLFMRRSKKPSKLRVTVFCEGISPVTGEFPAKRTSNAENVTIWWRHHVTYTSFYIWRKQGITNGHPFSYFLGGFTVYVNIIINPRPKPTQLHSR